MKGRIDMSNFDITSIISVPILALCFVLGYVIKNYTKVPNKYIPLIMVVVGAIASFVVSILNGDSATGSLGNSIITGAVSGLASTGSYEFIVNTFGLKSKKNESEDTADENAEEITEDETVTDDVTDDSESDE